MNQKERVRGLLEERIKIGKPIDSLLFSLANRAPSTLIDITIGLNPIGGAQITYALLPLLSQIELRLSSFPISPQHFYQRLAEGSEEAKGQLLDTVIGMHPEEDWICLLSQQIEGAEAGTRHLMAIYDQPYFHEMCHLYAQKGMRESLMYCCKKLGRVEPALALLINGTLDAGLQAGALALARNPSCGMVEYLCALMGPDIDLPLSTMIGYITDSKSLEKLEHLVVWYPRAKNMLKKQRNRRKKSNKEK
jgi:hypothetical protein